MKNTISIVLALLMALSLAACGETSAPVSSDAAADETINYTIATTSLTADTNQDQHMREIVDQLSAASNGRFKANIIDAGMQGTSREAVTSLQTGAYDILICCDMEVDMVIDSLAWAWTPFLVTNYEQADEYYYNGWISEKLAECMEQSGIIKIGDAENGNRVCGTVNTPIQTLEDFKGVKIRTPEIAGVVDFYTKCGATSVSISTNEVAMAMQQGMCDGVDNSIQNIRNTGVLDMCKYVTKTNHMYAGSSVVANKDFWESLSPEDQEMILSITEAAAEKYIPLYREEEETLFNTEGLTVIEPDEELMSAFYSIGEEIWAENKDKYPEDIVKLVDEQLAKNIAAFND